MNQNNYNVSPFHAKSEYRVKHNHNKLLLKNKLIDQESYPHEAVIVIIYHTKEEEVTQYHYNRFKNFNPEIPIVLIKHEDFELLPYWDYHDMWAHPDSILYRWFLSDKKILAERYFVFEYDTYCNDSIKNHYKDVWNDQAAASNHFSIQKYPSWSVFKKYPKHLNIYKDKLYGICPAFGFMLRHDDLSDLINEQINSTIWKDVYCELRIGSILNINGVKLSFINEQKKHYNSPSYYEIPKNYKQILGIFHPVKDKPKCLSLPFVEGIGCNDKDIFFKVWSRNKLIY